MLSCMSHYLELLDLLYNMVNLCVTYINHCKVNLDVTYINHCKVNQREMTSCCGRDLISLDK
jgi:hypothetical protein